MKTKIKSYSEEVTDFHGKEMPKAGSNYTCLAVTTIDSALKERWKLSFHYFTTQHTAVFFAA